MSVIVLTSNYQFWSEVTIQKALKWYVTNKIQIVKADESKEIGSCEFRIKAPLIVRLLKFMGYKPRRETINFSNEAVFQRDDNICQYWHTDENGKHYKYRCTIEQRTVDHILPISKGGKSTFENCVCSCRNCNEVLKKNRTPEEAEMKLIRKPFAPKRDFVLMRFAYNPNKLAHRIYYEQVLGRAFSHVVND